MSLRVISSMATRPLLGDLIDAWQGRGGARIEFKATGGVDAAKRVLDGEAFDVIVLAADAIEKLVAAGKIAAGSVAALTRSSVAVAVRQGQPRPSIEDEAALRAAVLSARSLGYSTGPSGIALQQLFVRWGIADEVRGRVVLAPPGVAVGTLIARGDVELGFQQLSELMHVEGVDVIGEMPPGIEIVTTFSGAVGVASADRDAARTLLDFIASPARNEAKRRHGMQPA